VEDANSFKEITEFGNDRRSKDGLSCYCKECSNKLVHPYTRKRNRPPKIPKMDKTISNKNMCNILQYHHNILNSDDEHLTTQFIVDLINHKI